MRLVVAYRYTQSRLDQVTNRQADIQKQKSDLDEQIRNLTSPDGIEYFVRDQYRAVAEGEQLVVLVDDAQPRHRVR